MAEPMDETGIQTRLCILCRQRPVNAGRACSGCVRAEIYTLAKIRRLWIQLTEQTEPIADTSRRRVRDADGNVVLANSHRLQRPAYLKPPRRPVKIDRSPLRHHDPVAENIAAGVPQHLVVDQVDLAMPAPAHYRSVWDELVPAVIAVDVTARLDYIRFVHGVDELGRPTVTAEYTSALVHGQARKRLHDGNGTSLCRICAVTGDATLHSATGTPLYTRAGDQVGHISAPALLDSWARSWADRRGQDEILPPATVPALLSWLAYRMADACDNDETIGDFSHETRGLLAALREVCGENEPDPEICYGVPCRKCDWLNVLVRRTDGSGYIECGHCGILLTIDEYYRWVDVCARTEKAA